jgi:SAM-dependent methyltransferase
MISDRLLSVVRCPDCGGSLSGGADLKVGTTNVCERCRREFSRGDGTFLDLRPSMSFTETTKYVDEALHADSRHETVSPPLLSAAVRNDMLREFLAPARDDRIVDLGCGSGRALVWNRDSGAYQVGVDVTPHFAREARASIDLVIGDLRRLPFADGAFTKAFSLDVAEHLSRESLVQVMTETRRVLAPGGAFFLYTHARRNSRIAVGLRGINSVARGLDRIGLISLNQERLRKSDHLNPLADIPDFRNVAAEAGFRVSRITYYTPLIGAVVENLFVRMAEGVLARRAVKRQRGMSAEASGADGAPRSGGAGQGAGAPGSNIEGLRAARLEAKRRIERRGPVYVGLRALTAVMKLDVLLFGRIETGPFFALLVKK